MMKNKTITHKQYVYGDFDKDGVANIDDRYPFDKTKKRQVNKEIKFSETLKYLEKKRSEARQQVKPFARKRGMKYRIKGPYSTINKLVRTRLNTLGDFGGVRKVSENRKSAKKDWKKFNKKEKKKVTEIDDKYKANKYSRDNPYRAYHTNFKLKNIGVEAQFMSKPMENIAIAAHKAYKNKKDMKPYVKRTKKAIKKGY